MIIDDDSTSLAIGRALLEADYQTILMKSGLQALGYLKNHKLPNLVLLDVMMPGTNGMEVLKAFKSNKEYSNIPVLFLTSSEDVDSEIEGFTLGAADFIRKPVVPILLKKKIETQFRIIDLIKENERLKSEIKSRDTQIKRLINR